LEAKRFWGELVGTKEAGVNVEELEGFYELARKVFATLPPEEVLKGYTPEERVAGLPPEQLLPALPEEMLRALSDDFVEALPEPTRSTVRQRRGR
jgi:hypothetical protein